MPGRPRWSWGSCPAFTPVLPFFQEPCFRPAGRARRGAMPEGRFPCLRSVCGPGGRGRLVAEVFLPLVLLSKTHGKVLPVPHSPFSTFWCNYSFPLIHFFR